MQELFLNITTIGPPFLISIGALQGLILTCILGFKAKYRFRSIQFFALLLLTISVINIYGALDMINQSTHPLFEDYIPYFWSNLIPPSTYFFIRYLTRSDYKFKNIDYLFFLPVTIDFCYQTVHFINFLWHGAYDLNAYNHFDQTGNTFELIAAVYSTIIFSISIYRIIYYQQNVKKGFSTAEVVNLQWAMRFLIIGLAISLGWMYLMIYNVYTGNLLRPLALAIWISVTLLIYWTAYSMLSKRSLFELQNRLQLRSKTSIDERDSLRITVADHKRIENNLNNLTKNKFFLNPDLSLYDMASELDVSPKKLSTYLNQHLHIHFFDYINQLRVAEFKARLRRGDYHQLSIVGIAQQCGFKSKSSFYRAFKKIENTTPSNYLNSLSKGLSR